MCHNALRAISQNPQAVLNTVFVEQRDTIVSVYSVDNSSAYCL